MNFQKLWGIDPAATPPKEQVMSSTAAAVPAAPKPSFLERIWGWFVGAVKHVEADVEAIIGSDEAVKLEGIIKNVAAGPWGQLAAAAIVDATDVVTGQMNVVKAISSLIALAEADGKQISKAGALQLLGLLQNTVPVATNTATTVVPS